MVFVLSKILAGLDVGVTLGKLGDRSQADRRETIGSSASNDHFAQDMNVASKHFGIHVQ